MITNEMERVIADIRAERIRQVDVEGWPFAAHWWKPENGRRDLVKAGALIIAEIERLDRLAMFEAAP